MTIHHRAGKKSSNASTLSRNPVVSVGMVQPDRVEKAGKSGEQKDLGRIKCDVVEFPSKAAKKSVKMIESMSTANMAS